MGFEEKGPCLPMCWIFESFLIIYLKKEMDLVLYLLYCWEQEIDAQCECQRH